MRIEAITRPWHDDGVDISAFRGMKKVTDDPYSPYSPTKCLTGTLRR